MAINGHRLLLDSNQLVTSGQIKLNRLTGARILTIQTDDTCPECCFKCIVRVRRIYECSTRAWGPPIADRKRCEVHWRVPVPGWFTGSLGNIGCIAYYWYRLAGTCATCDAVTIPSADDTNLGEPTTVDVRSCCLGQPPVNLPQIDLPPADGTDCEVDNQIYITCTGFSIDHTCKTVYNCDTTPNPHQNVAGGHAQILNGTSGNNFAAFLNPNGLFVGSSIDWPRRDPGEGSGSLADRLRSAHLVWGLDNPTPCEANELFGDNVAELVVEIDCRDPAFDTVRVFIDFPFRQNECDVRWAFDSGVVQTSKSAGLRKSITLSDFDGTPNVFLTNGTITISYCCS